MLEAVGRRSRKRAEAGMNSSLCATIAAAFSCRRRSEPFPGLLAEAPFGEVVIKMQVSPDARTAIARDLGRFWRVVTVLGREERRPLAAGAAGNGAEELFAAIAAELGAELTAQGWGLDMSGRTKSGDGGVDPVVLENLAEIVATHLTVGPGIDVAVRTQLLPTLALHEPTFIVAVGAGQVRVVTFLRVGGQGAGNESYWQQPPVVVKLTTCDLVPVAVKAASSAEASGSSSGGEHVSVMPVAYAAERVVRGTRSMTLHVRGNEQRLFGSAARGDWSHREPVSPPKSPTEEFEDEDEEKSLTEPLLARQ